MNTNNSTHAVLTFQETEFDVVDMTGQAWLRGAQVALALGYQNPANAIKDLYARNEEEFDDNMTQIVELDTAGGRQPVRIFSPRGCYLLGMFARTDKARDFRRWVLDVLEGQAAPRVGKTMTFPQHLAALRYRGALVEKLARTTERGAAVELYANLRQISRMLGMVVSDLETIAAGLKQTSLPGV